MCIARLLRTCFNVNESQQRETAETHLGRRKKKKNYVGVASERSNGERRKMLFPATE